MYDLLVKDACLYGEGKRADIAVENGRIAEVAPGISEGLAKELVDAAGNLVAPGFVDSHMHFDKALSLGEEESPTLKEAIANFTKYVNGVPAGEIRSDIKRRAKNVARMCCLGGTTALRTHANVEAALGLAGVEALNEVKEELKDFLDIRITALPSFYDGSEAIAERMKLLDEAAGAGLLDYIGGAPHLHKDCARITEELFALAVKHDLPVDFHVDEHDHPDVENFMQIARLTKQYGYEGRVSCGHVTALCAVDDATAEKAIQLAKEARLHIITLPSCNLYLMGRSDHQPIRRGVTRIREFSDAGVNISYASDNIRDPFRPIGNGDMLEEGLITAQVAQMVTKSELERVFAMGTVNPANSLEIEGYGLQKGCRADFVVFDKPSVAEALASQATRNAVVKNGRVVAHTQKTTECLF